MGDSFLYGVAGNILKRVAAVIENEIILIAGVKSELNEFVKTLSTIKAVLLDAEERPEKSHELKNWLGRLNDVCSDAEDMLGEFEYEILRQDLDANRSSRIQVCNFLSRSNIKFRSKMGHKLQDLKKSLDKIAVDKEQFRLTKRDEGWGAMPMDRDKPMDRHKPDSFVPTSEVLGRDKDMEKIIRLLTRTSDEENVSVIPIVGMAGLGKSTLAKSLNADETVANHFQKMRIWVSPSEDFNIRNVAADIINCVDDQKDCGDLKWDKLEKLLQKTLECQMFLLILDNVCKIERGKWVDFKNLLMVGAKGSKIIVTTRELESVANIVCTTPEHIYQLGGLSYEDCCSLFVNWAFRKGEEKRHRNLLNIGMEIVKKCGGVPHEVRTIGCTLFGKRDVRDWNAVMKKLEQGGTDVSPAARLSYDRLPSHLKKCFAFCSLFPKNYKFNSLQLIRLWIARGLVESSDENPDLEYIGWKYIKELRSLFQNVEEHGDVLTFEMHDLMHALASNVAQVDFSSGKIYSKSDRQLSITRYIPSKRSKRFLPTESNVRTIICPNGGVNSKSFAATCISRFQYLRILDLKDSQLEKLPSDIGKLKLLRYLNLKNSSIKKLPGSICDLLNLQTLDLSNCSKLEKLPRDIGNWINLRCWHITTKQNSLPEDGIKCLKSLRFLGIVKCSNLVSLGEGMKYLTALQTLLIEDCRSLESLPISSMKYLNSLETLFIYNCEKLHLMEGEEDIQDLNLGLRSLWIVRLPQLVALPQWLRGAAETLEQICIGDCCKITALLGWLPNFTSLKKLVIEDCPELLALPEGMDSFPELELKIENCPKLSRQG